MLANAYHQLSKNDECNCFRSGDNCDNQRLSVTMASSPSTHSMSSKVSPEESHLFTDETSPKATTSSNVSPIDFIRKHRHWQAKAQSFAKSVYDMKSIFGCSELDAQATETYARILFNSEPGLRDLDRIVGIYRQATDWRARFMGRNHASTVRCRTTLAKYKNDLQYEANRRVQPLSNICRTDGNPKY